MKKIFLTNKEELTEFFATEKEGLKLIEKYEKNIDFFDDLLEKGSVDDILLVVSIKIHKYADPLITNGCYTKAFKALEGVENDLEKVREDSEWYEFYAEKAVFLKAVCLGRLRKYRESNQYFEELIKKNPENDGYLDWYKSNNKNQMGNVANGIAIAGLAIYLLSIAINIVSISDFQIPKAIELSALSITILALTTSYIWGKIIDKQRAKIKEKTNTAKG